MIIRIAFDLQIPDTTPAAIVKAAAKNAAAAAENTVERQMDLQSVAGTARITIKTNEPTKKGPR